MALAPSSPRLPSPLAAAEIQIGRRPPSPQAAQLEHDINSRRRIHPGTKVADMAAGPPLVPLNELDSAFQLQEHLAASHYHHVASGTRAITRSTALQLAQPPTGIDRTLWLYELCRFLISQCNSLIVGFLFDKPPCSTNTCPEMRASEWQFLCAVHEQPKSCCAIDYCCHTLDWAANVVSDQKIFPSRFAVLGEAHSKNVGVKNLVNVFRRLHRIFAHAWFQHRNVFWTVEGQTGLYVFFKTVCDLYDLLPAENYKLPPEAEGLENPAVVEAEAARLPPPTILKPPHQRRGDGSDDDDGLYSIGRTNTRRHIRNSPSTGSAVTTVMETDEEETDALTNTLAGVHIPKLAARRTRDEKPETAEISVIVEELTPDRAEAPAATKEVRGFAAEEASDEGQVVATEKQNAKGRDTTEIDQTCSWTRGLAAADGAPSRAPEPEPASEHAPATAGAEEQCAEATETSAPVEPGQDSGGTLASRTEERTANS